MTDLSGWPALVLTAGLATRLRPLSDIRAKAAMPVAGDPIVGRILRWLRAAGVRRVVLNLHHRPETITRLVGDGGQWDMQVRYSWEREVLGSAGGPRRALPLLDAERILVVNGDTLTDCDLPALVDRHTRSGALVTMAVVAGDVVRYGGVLVDADHVVQGFGRPRAVAAATSGEPAGTAGTTPLHFIGVQAVESVAFAAVPDDRPSETVRTLYPRLIAERPRAIAAFVSGAEFLDVGTASDYLETVATVAAREARGFDRGEDCEVSADAEVTRTVLWDGVTVGAGARLRDCVVADGVRVPEGGHYERAVLIQGPEGLEATSF